MQALIHNAIQMINTERELYLRLHPKSVALSTQTNEHFLYSVPMHWMNDWGHASANICKSG